MIRHGVFLCVLIAIMISGCSSDRAHSKFLILADPLDSEVANWNRTGKLYRQFDTNLIVDVIYNDQRLRNMWIERTAKAASLSDEQKRRLSNEQKKENETYAQFYMALYTPDEDWNNLADSDSKWSVFLKSDTQIIRPVSIDKVDLESLPWSGNLPFEPNFRIFYRLNFPRNKAGFGAQRLVLSSLLGEVKLMWMAK